MIIWLRCTISENKMGLVFSADDALVIRPKMSPEASGLVPESPGLASAAGPWLEGLASVTVQ